MKKSKIIAAIGGLGLAAVATFMIAADHIDSPSAAADAGHDIADLYAFEGEDADNTVFIATLSTAQDALAGNPLSDFDEDVLIEFNIDVDGDVEEDFVIQAIPRDGVMYFFGPYATTAATIGLNSTIDANATIQGSANIDGAAVTASNGLKYYAGKRNDAFFFDFNQFNAVKGGTSTAPGGGFFTTEANATDLFVGLDVNAVVVEVPNSMLGAGYTNPVTGQVVYNVWVETKRKQ